ncbi:DUF4426 domain-containing protein [Psychrobium sp. 1_MG-2023]|uniref:DUF4426 domain-containing protein n=1 Tax=Psychrobium sp. 1_MG-2023 TaxID=3062624 RepID=UPI000C349308|nr:DUF4426 domain-containing protein [Psychrobium sp. 1_MG-2023]MDP2562369.1 DUF4426 domain-containing protein [Psychrobium sp. 1_MG-2023]PKF55865.1 DUF4426 domain-containing protein [Alteromonadales bacterium alter-6D02]
MATLRTLFLFISLLSLSLISTQSFANSQTQGGQFQQSGRYQVHYMALSSTFLTPQVAMAYNIKRSRYNAFVNISVLDTLIDGNPAVKANITGKAVNLTGNTRQLTFKEVIEGNAIYYIAELPFRNEERFTIQINSSNKDGLNSRVSFKQQFYADQ